jgi:hypothetical protein
VRAAEFVPGWALDGAWDSNVFRSTTDRDADFLIRTGPNIQFREKQGDLRYDVSYRPRYEAYIETEGINEFDHFANAGGEWQATRTTRFSLDNVFAYTSSLSTFLDTQLVGAEQVSVVSPERQRITLNSGGIGVVHQLTPRWELSARFSSQLYEYETNNNADSLANSGQVQLTRGFTPRLVAGFGGQVQRQDFDGIDFGNGEVTDENGTTFYQGFGIFSYAFSRTLRFSLNAGPAWSVPDAPPNEVNVFDYQPVDPSTCTQRRPDGTALFNTSRPGGGCQAAVYRLNGPTGTPVFFVTPGLGGAPEQERTEVPFVGEIAEGSLSYFGRLSVSKEWKLWTATAAFERTASTSSGVGGSTVLSSFTGTLRWLPTPEWTVDFSAIYTLQEAANDVREQLLALNSDPDLIPDVPDFNGIPSFDLVADPVGIPFEVDSGGKIDNVIEINTYRLELFAERRITRNLRLVGSASYWHQESEGDFRERGEQEIIRVNLGVTWTFDPIPL